MEKPKAQTRLNEEDRRPKEVTITYKHKAT